MPFYFVCFRNRAFVHVLKVISSISSGLSEFLRVFLMFFFIYLFYHLNTEHARLGNAKAISSTILAAPPHLETYRSSENKLRKFVVMFYHSLKKTHLLNFSSTENSHFLSVQISKPFS